MIDQVGSSITGGNSGESSCQLQTEDFETPMRQLLRPTSSFGDNRPDELKGDPPDLSRARGSSTQMDAATAKEKENLEHWKSGGTDLFV